MSVIRLGSTEKYADNWDRIFSKPSKSKAGSTKNTKKKKPTKSTKKK